MSCLLTGSPRPEITSPFSLTEFCFESLLLALCRSATLVATTTPFAFCHGPLPMRSRALTAPEPLVLRYARHVRPGPAAPTDAARCSHSASAPERPPRFAP